MNEDDVRRILVEALDAANVTSMRHRGLEAPFAAGETDVPLAALGIDSLAAMELCIAIEVHTGVTLVPEELARIATLRDLARTIQARAA